MRVADERKRTVVGRVLFVERKFPRMRHNLELGQQNGDDLERRRRALQEQTLGRVLGQEEGGLQAVSAQSHVMHASTHKVILVG